MNRAPSLHEYSIFCMKLRLTEGNSLEFPIAVCSPLNADFDGDTVSISLVPPEMAEDTYQKMSPRYVTYYKKNMNPIPEINHETLNGLAVLSEWTPENPSELTEPRYYYTDYSKLLKDVEVDKIIKVGTPICFTGKISNKYGETIDFQSKVTTYGKLRISKILGIDMDNLQFTKTPYERMNSGAARKLSAYLCDFPDNGVEKRRDLQILCLRAVTLAGNVSFDYKTLYTDTDTKTYKELCDIADSPDLTDQQKLVLLTEKYAQYEKETQAQFSDDLKDELNRAGRVKISSISALNMPQLIVSGVDEKPIITRGSLLSGYTERDMVLHYIDRKFSVEYNTL